MGHSPLETLRREVAACRACPLWEPATQAVCGEGPADARLLLVGEQPGDREDIEGRPFVGPAGTLLDRALAEADLDRLSAYLTNVVKHFAFTPKGRRRIHRTPSAREVAACRPWLDRELDLIDPEVVVALGATAAQALLGRSFRVTVDRGRVIEWEGRRVVATVHPSSILRARSSEDRHAQMAAFVRDLEVAAGLLGEAATTRSATTG